MARRRKKQELDPIQSIVMLLMVGAFWGVYKITSSFTTSSIAAGTILGIYFAIYFIVYKNKIERLRNSGIFEIDKMEGREFELYLGELFRSYGYKTEVTQMIGDYGADLVISKDDKRIVVQAKRYKNNVGLKAVQEIYTAKNHYGASEAWVITNSGFTQQACNLAKSNGVRLINRKQLIDMILNKNKVEVVSIEKNVVDLPSVEPKQTTTEKIKEQTEIDKCPKCGYFLVKRKSERGEFYGCSNYPKCKHTVSIKNKNLSTT